jgi:hypothetical protein
MPLGNWNLQWLNHNSQRAYPLTERASKGDISDLIEIPDDFIVGLYFPVHAGNNVQPDKFFLRTLLINPTGYNIAIAYDNGDDDPPLVATVNIARSTHTENMVYALPGVNDFAESVGRVAIGNTATVDGLPPGQYHFTPEAGELEFDTIWPMVRGVSSITLVNGADRSAKIYGDIELIAGNNIRLTPVIVEGEDPQIIISAISGEGLNEDCVCDEEELGPAIRTINGIGPLPSGDFRMLGDECLLLNPITNGLQLEDDCSQPCCGCDKLDAINGRLDAMTDQLVTLNSFANRVQTEVTQMANVVLGSRLGDRSCLEC